MIEVYFGFHAPSLRNMEGRIDPRLWLGHCEMWGYNADMTWLFIDPRGIGTAVLVEHRRDEVGDQIQARFETCRTILRWNLPMTPFRIPIFGPMNCAAICGSFVGLRALSPAGLERKLRRAGAEVIHDAEREPQGQGGPPS